VRDQARATWDQTVRGLFFLNGSSHLAMPFVQALAALEFRPVLLSHGDVLLAVGWRWSFGTTKAEAPPHRLLSKARQIPTMALRVSKAELQPLQHWVEPIIRVPPALSAVVGALCNS
jgi:hypothetical protein